MYKKITAALLSIFLIGSTMPLTAFAANDYRGKDEVLSDQVSDVIYLLKEVFEDRYEAAEDEVKKLVSDNGYDYALTMDSFYDQPNPFKDADYVRYLAAYMSCKKYAKEHSMEAVQLRDIPFLTADTEVSRAEEYVPTKIPVYTPSGNMEGEYYYCMDSYIQAPTEVDVYERQNNGTFRMTGEKQMVEPEKREVDYLDVTLQVITPDDIFAFMGIDRELVDDDYERRTEMIKRVRTNESIAQTLLLRLPEIDFSVNEGLSEYASYIEGAEGIRKTIIQTALSLVGKVPYEWAGKATAPGYDTRWWTYNEDNGLQHGLDCSGFVQWTFMTSGFPSDIYGKLYSTKNILENMPGRIDKEDLKPGDIGVTNRAGGVTNHTGIYIGDGLWCHCSSGKKTVTVSEYGSFCVFFDPVALTDSFDQGIIESYAGTIANGLSINNSYNISKDIDTYNSLYYTHKYSNEDVMLLAELISLKARGEGMNCWTAMGEVMVNRVSSEMFPDSLSEVIYQHAGDADLSLQEPTQEMINVAKMVLSGNMSVLERKDAIFYYDLRDLSDEDDEESGGGVFEKPKTQWEKTIGCYVFYSL